MAKEKKEKEDYSNIRIRKVVLNDEGLKGIKVQYEKVEVVGEREYRNEFNPSMKYPVHGNLLKCFGWLKGHMLAICGYEKDDLALQNALTVTGVMMGESGFIISGKLEVFENGKVISLNTPLTTGEDEYLDYMDVVNIIDGIYEETKVYLSKTVVMDDVQLVLKFHKGDEKFSKESFMALPESEQKLFATKVLEKMKSVVIHQEDLDIGDINGLEGELAAEIISEDTSPVVIMGDEDDFELPIDGKVEEDEKIPVEEDDDDFSLGIKVAVATKSTTKKISK